MEKKLGQAQVPGITMGAGVRQTCGQEAGLVRGLSGHGDSCASSPGSTQPVLLVGRDRLS